MPPGDYATAASISRRFLDRDDAIARPEVQTEYFKELFRSVDTDGRGIQKLRAEFDYPEVASRFRLIEPSESVAVLYGTKRERQFVIGALERLRAGAPGAGTARLQPIGLPRRNAGGGTIEPVTTGLGLRTGEYDAATCSLWARRRRMSGSPQRASHAPTWEWEYRCQKHRSSQSVGSPAGEMKVERVTYPVTPPSPRAAAGSLPEAAIDGSSRDPSSGDIAYTRSSK
jgi:hypothetical protein